MKIFNWDSVKQELSLNAHELMLIKEFKALFDTSRNKRVGDPQGVLKLRAWNELKYIYLSLDWNSLYKQYTVKERHEAAMEDASLKPEDFKDEVFMAACKKYKAMLEKSKILKLINTADKTLEKMRVYLEGVSFDERDPVTQRPIYTAKEVLGNIASISDALDNLKVLENKYKSELQEASAIRGDAKKGAFD